MKSRKAAKPHTKKLRTMGLSLFLAIIVWFMVMSLTNPSITTTISNLNVRFVGERDLRDKELVVTGRSSIPALSVSVRGSRSDLMNYMDDIYVQVDVGSIDTTGTYNLTGTISIPTTRISVEKENYSDIPITVEPLVSKEIEVSIKQTGTLKGKLVKSEADNPKVIISGAQSELDNVSSAAATVDITHVREEHPERVSYLLTDDSGALITDNETIESNRGEIEVINTVYDAVTLPVEPVLSAELNKIYVLKTDKTTVSPSSVTVGVKSGTEYESVAAVIDRVSEGEGEYLLKEKDEMYIPAQNRTVHINAELAGKTSEQLELPVETENLGEGLTASVDGNLHAVVWGENGQVNTDNVHAAVNLQGLGKGEYTLPVYIKERDFELGGEYKINVTIE